MLKNKQASNMENTIKPLLSVSNLTLCHNFASKMCSFGLTCCWDKVDYLNTGLSQGCCKQSKKHLLGDRAYIWAEFETDVFLGIFYET